MSEIRFETPYSQAFYHKSVNESPQQRAQRKMDAFRAATVEAARLDPNVASIQFGTISGDGIGGDWAVTFSEKDYNVDVKFDVVRKTPFRTQARKIGYIISVTIIQECRPMTENPGTMPRHILMSLVP
ncbi:hypothetical protein N7530_008711 [Penicillium desertorum]|uniref:Uncharacterized protein n=1 Tax=Penicillium desertorum TaxID=1303715 RepID=A0A9X0BL88_9EURO|nr:hypothetical protein N7530_008711 [Penicillium desertorum]